MSQCEYKRYYGKRYYGNYCEETAQAGQSLCILHDKDPIKDAAGFLKTLKDKVEREERDSTTTGVNLAGVVFPPGFSWADVVGRGKALGKNAHFLDATFSGDADFASATFSGDAGFWGTTFTGNAYFMGATFSGNASFASATFTRAAYFGGATFQDRLRFHGTTFPRDEGTGMVTFSYVTLEKPERVYFQDVNLSRVSFLDTDLRHVHFLNASWAKLPRRPRPSPRWWPFTAMRAVGRQRTRWPRAWPLVLMTAIWRRRPTWLRQWPHGRPLNVLHDDPRVSGGGMPQEPAFHRAAELYRQLRVNLEENRQHIEAGDFYVGQMDMRLHDSSLGGLHRGLLRLYGVAALYGESYWRPLFLYFALGLLFAVGYLWGGFQGIEEVVHRNVWVGPGALWDWSFWRDYVQAFLVALTPGAPFRAEPQFFSWWLRPVQYVNTLLNVVLLALAVIALRRAFRR